MLLDQNEIIPRIKSIVDENTKEVIISSAYIKSALLEELQSTFKNKEVRIYVQWKLNDLINGASDIDVYLICKKNEWKLFRNDQIHAKFILIDNSIVILGSSNYTLSGTGRNRNNIERNYLVSLDTEEVNNLLKDFSHSTKINDKIYGEMKSFIDNQVPEREYEHLKFEDSIFNEDQEDYNEPFSFELLPPFRPNDNSFDPAISDHLVFLKNHNIISHHDYRALSDFITNNPVSILIKDFLNERNANRCQWGKVERLIMANERLFGLVNNNRELLKSELGRSHKLFNLFCWLEYFHPEIYFVWNRDNYLNDPREGTCSLNIHH